MPPHSALLSCVLCLQVRDRNLCCCGAFSPRPFRRARKRRVLSELLALRRLQIPARDIESSRRGYDNPRAHRKHTAVVRTPARGTRTTVVVNLYHTPGSLRNSQKRPPTLAMQLDPEKVLQRIEPLFQENFETFGELGAAVSV